MQKNKDNPFLILASKSPRRRHLLKQAGLSFKVIPSTLDEKSVPESPPEEYVKTLSEGKSKDIAIKFPDSFVIGADTIVTIENKILGKPDSEMHAMNMLKNLSNKTHQVFTGYSICCINKGHFFSEVVKTDVVFKELSDEEIRWYIKTKEPFDKAGAYAIQGHGAQFIKRINGSYTNVVGLPLSEIIEYLFKSEIINFSDIENIHIEEK